MLYNLGIMKVFVFLNIKFKSLGLVNSHLKMDQDNENAPNTTIPLVDEEAEAPGVFELINRVSNRRLLYDAKDERHKHRGLVKNAWDEVAKDLKVGGEVKNGK